MASPAPAHGRATHTAGRPVPCSPAPDASATGARGPPQGDQGDGRRSSPCRPSPLPSAAIRVISRPGPVTGAARPASGNPIHRSVRSRHSSSASSVSSREPTTNLHRLHQIRQGMHIMQSSAQGDGIGVHGIQGRPARRNLEPDAVRQPDAQMQTAHRMVATHQDRGALPAIGMPVPPDTDGFRRYCQKCSIRRGISLSGLSKT